MKRFVFFFVAGFAWFGIVCLAQDSRSDRRDRGDRSDRGSRPPWMQGGPMGSPGGSPWGGGPGGQPPWMQGGPGGSMGGPPPWMQGGPGGDSSRSDADRNERTIGMLRSMDTNGNGKLEQSEIPEYRRGFVSMIVTRMGGDPNKTIDLADLARKAASSSSSRSSASSSSSGSSRSSAGMSTATDPLVPYFGEKEPEQTPVLTFGQREAKPKTTLAVSNSATSVNQSDQILRSARDVMNKYDKNKNGTLDKDKGEWVSSLPFNADSADKNRDGRISMTELLNILGGKAGATTGSAAISTKQSASYDRLPPGMPDWFFERDKDQDAQLTMMEYANGQPWSEAVADEFRFLDKNNDGVATVTEVFETLKQVDEEKRLKEDQAKRDVERRKGAGTVAAAPPGTSPGTPPPPPSDGQQAGSASPPPTGTAPPPTPPVAGGTQPPLPTPTVAPGEPAPNWRPSSTPAVPSAPPSTAPYSSGSSRSSDSDRSSRSRDYQRSRSRGR